MITSVEELKPKVLVIVGPTASGKSDLAFALAERYNGEIISADSRQIYRSMTIGTGKPPQEMLERVRHHFIDELEPEQAFDAAQFAVQGWQRIEQIRSRGKVPIVVGGSTLYVSALVKGFSQLPPSNPEIRSQLATLLKEQGLAALVAALRARDPDRADVIDCQNPQRVLRSLEMSLLSDTPIHQHMSSTKQSPPYHFDIVRLVWERHALYQRIHRRVEAMIDSGFEAEAQTLYERYIKGKTTLPNALLTVGYREYFDYFNGIVSKDTLTASIQQATRHYAKRQETYFRNQCQSHAIEMPLTLHKAILAVTKVSSIFSVHNEDK